MCCFSGPMEIVADTNLFARRTGSDRQFLVYQMRFEARQPVAMILPIPIALPAVENAVRFIDLKGYADFFVDLKKGFPAPKLPSFLLMMLPKSRSSAAAAPIRVESVGDFVASFVPKIADFKRLDRRFVLPENVWDQLPSYRDFGFAVFQLKALGGTPHPMAFEFPTRLASEVFFPTVHIHDGKVHQSEHFDHALYVQDIGPHGRESQGSASEFMDLSKTQGIVSNAPVRQLLLTGELPNTDTILSKLPTQPNSRLALWGGAALLAGLGYAGYKKQTNK
jgi:hypothetical protein